MSTLKRYINFTTALLVVVLSVTSCGEDFLDRSPLNGYTISNFFENETQITEAVTALYPSMRGIYVNTLHVLGEVRSDNTTFQFNAQDRGNTRTEEVDYFLSNSAMGDAAELWNNAYTAIGRTNLILDRIDEADFLGDDELREVRRAETRFVRAMMYWQLVRAFDEVILITEPEFDEAALLEFKRTSVEQIYNEVIVPDAQFAIDNLPSEWPAAQQGRVTKGAAQTLLASAHFTRRDYAAALPVLDSIVASMTYSLMPDYRGVFDPALKTQNTEVIFAGQFSVSAKQGANYMINWLPLFTGNELTGGGTAPVVGPRGGFNIPTRDLVNAYEDGDLRFDASIGTYVDGSDTVFYNRKFLFTPIPSDTDFPIFRYADVLLMQAEAALIVNGDGGLTTAIANINALRTRASLELIFPGNPNPDLDIRDAASALIAVRNERRVEMALEHQRWFDLVRYETFEQVMIEHGTRQKTIQTFLQDFPEAYDRIPEFFPIPNLEVVKYGYRQNPGY